MKLKYVLQLTALIAVLIATIVLSLPTAKAGIGEAKGVTVVFDGGAVAYLPECRMSDFAKTRFGKTEGDSASWSDCGGGTESLARINAASVLGICGGNCR